MELEMFIIGFLFGTAAVSVIIGFFHINKDDISTPLHFFRVKVYQARACLSCDTIYHDSEQSCPLCFEKGSIPLRKYFSPLSPLRIIKEEKNEKIITTLSMVGEEKRPDNPDTEPGIDSDTSSTDIKHDAAQTNQQSRFAPDYSHEPHKPKSGGIYHSDRIELERKRNLKQRGNWAYAGYAKFLKIIKDGFVLSGKEHTRRV